MSASERIPLEQVMPPRRGSVDPSAFPDEEFELYSIPAFDQGAPEILTGSRIGSAKQVVCSGDVLLSRIVPHIRRAWVVGKQNGRRLIASGEWIVFRGDDADPGYLRQVLVSDRFHAEFMRTVSGVGGSLLRARPANVAKIEIPLPPLLEQRRIAAILDKADALRAKRRAAIQKLDELTQSIFLDMFGDPTRNPKGWPLAKLCAVTAAINDCPHSTPKWTEKGHICLRTSNLTVGGWDWNDTRYVSGADYAERSRRGEICPGDIILSREGTVGIGAIVQPAMHVCMGQRLVHLRPNERMNSEFLLRHLLHILAPIRIGKSMVGSTSRHLNVKELRNLKVPVPPVDIQHGFAQAIREIRYLTQLQLKAIGCLNALFASLQHLAFRGELWADFDEESEDAHAFRR